MDAEIISADTEAISVGIAILIGDALFLATESVQAELTGRAEFISDARVVSRCNILKIVT